MILFIPSQFTSVQFSHSVVSDSLWPHEPQHTRAPCPSPTPGVHSNSCPSSQWCHPTIPSSVVPFSSCPQSFPTSGSFQMSQLFASGGQSIGVSASTSVLPMNTQDWSPLGWTGWISLQSEGLSKESSPTLQFKSINSSVFSIFYGPTVTSIHDYWKNHRFDYMDLCLQSHISAFNRLSGFVIVFLPRSKCLSIWWLRSPSAVILEHKKIKSATVFISLPIYLPWNDGTGCYDLCCLNVEF